MSSSPLKWAFVLFRTSSAAAFPGWAVCRYKETSRHWLMLRTPSEDHLSKNWSLGLRDLCFPSHVLFVGDPGQGAAPGAVNAPRHLAPGDFPNFISTELTTARRSACLHWGMSLQKRNENTSLPPRDAVNTVGIMSWANETGHKRPSEAPTRQEGCGSAWGCPWEEGGQIPPAVLARWPGCECFSQGVAPTCVVNVLLWKVPSLHIKTKAAACRLHECAVIPPPFFSSQLFFVVVFALLV